MITKMITKDDDKGDDKKLKGQSKNELRCSRQNQEHFNIQEES